MYLIRMACVEGQVAWPGREGLYVVYIGWRGWRNHTSAANNAACCAAPSHAPHMALMQP